MAKSSNSSRRIRTADLYVNPEDRPGWHTGDERAPEVGEEVYCAGGAGRISAVLGKTGDGSRLLEIELTETEAKPFFAAASNVLVAPAAKPKRRKRRGAAPVARNGSSNGSA